MSEPNCPCDKHEFPPHREVAAGLSSVPRQLATFPEFRAAMLSAIGQYPALRQWRARGSDDFGVMLLEMWAYVCDVTSFYDEVIANESLLRTAQLRASVRKLVGLLGYVPRPAVAAIAELALLAEGRQYVKVPKGTAFRSGAFPGSAPQVFELDADSRVHPFTNKWALERQRPVTIDPGPTYSATRNKLLVDPKSVAVKRDQLILVQHLTVPANTRMRTVTSVDSVKAADGATYKQITLSDSVPIHGSLLPSVVRLSTPGQTAAIRELTPLTWGLIGALSVYHSGQIVFDGLQPQLQSGDLVVIERAGEFRWFTVYHVSETTIDLPAPGNTVITAADGTKTTIAPPAPKMRATWAVLDRNLNDPSHREGSYPDWVDSNGAGYKVHLGFRRAATLTVPAKLQLMPGDALKLLPPVEAPQDGKAPPHFLLEDRDGNSAEIDASINFIDRTLTPVEDLTKPLTAPVVAYGNVVTVSRGETVAGEVLGSGDAYQASQTFKLKKSPLTYFPAPDGVRSTLQVYVDGLRWTEVPTFFGVGPEDQVYIVRQNDAGESLITFGIPLPTGANNIVAYYRFGGGEASPPAGSINQLAKPVKGITSVKNPVPAYGGDDAEAASGLRTYAPRSALLLGRAISIPDMEAAAATVGGVRAVRAEWRWNALRQAPVVQVWYIGADSLRQSVIDKLRGLSDSLTPIAVDAATPVPSILSLGISIDPRRIEADVLAEVRAVLLGKETGLLTPENIGVGLPLFRSRIFEAVLAVPGATAVTGVFWDDAPMDDWGITPGAGNYFDLEAGALLLNGKAGADG